MTTPTDANDGDFADLLTERLREALAHMSAELPPLRVNVLPPRDAPPPPAED